MVTLGDSAVKVGGSVGQTPAPGPGTDISEKGSTIFSKFLLFAKLTSSGERPFLCESVSAEEKGGRNGIPSV